MQTIRNFWGRFGTGSIISTRCSHLGFALPRIFLTNCPMPLNGFYSTNLPSPAHILDDFLIVEPPCPNPPLDSRCRASLLSMILTFKTLNIPISASKSEGPSQIIQFMAIILDSGEMEARLTVDKVERIKGALSNFQSRRSTTWKNFNH